MKQLLGAGGQGEVPPNLGFQVWRNELRGARKAQAQPLPADSQVVKFPVVKGGQLIFL